MSNNIIKVRLIENEFIYIRGDNPRESLGLGKIPKSDVMFYEPTGSDCKDVVQQIEQCGKNANDIELINISHVNNVVTKNAVHALKWTFDGLEQLPNLKTIKVCLASGLHDICNSLSKLNPDFKRLILTDAYYIHMHEIDELNEYCSTHKIVLSKKFHRSNFVIEEYKYCTVFKTNELKDKYIYNVTNSYKVME